jgi:5S rRNA maturation endonuclease (ribonuclease M5)
MGWVNDSQAYMLFEDPSNVLGKSIDGKFFARMEIGLLPALFGSYGSLGEFASNFPQVKNFLSEIVLIDDYLARKLEQLEKGVFRGILEPRLDKKVIEKLNEIYDVKAEGLTYIPISPTTEGFRLALPTQDVSLHVDEMGDGVKYATVILSLCFLLKDTAFLIEEIESHQHSGAIAKLIPKLVEIANQRNIQLFLTTHSIEVMKVLSQLPEEYDIHFFHLENKRGEIDVRHLGRNIDVKLLLDLGVDVRYLETYRKFIVVEGKNDVQFFRSLLRKYGRSEEEVGYLVKADNKKLVNQVSAALLSTKKEVIVAMDYDAQNEEALIQSLTEVLKSKNYRIQNQKNNTLEMEGNLKITLLPMGLYNDERLKQIGIKQFEMEDYCLKLIETDEKLRKWAGVTLEKLVEEAKQLKQFNIEVNTHKSSGLLSILALKKDKAYEDLIDYIINNASDQALEKVGVGKLMKLLLE